jgi:hypothetical protein
MNNKNITYLQRHSTLIKKYCVENNISYRDREEFYEALAFNPQEAVLLLKDFEMSSTEKYNRLLNELFGSEYCVVGIIGSPGSGKTSTALRILGDYWERSEKKARIFSFQNVFKPVFFKGVVWDTSQIPNNSIIYIDELAHVFPARAFMTENNQKLVSRLIDLRHKNVKIFGSTQRARLVDLVYFDFCNFLFYKYVDLSTMDQERQFLFPPLIQWLLPREFSQKSKVVVKSPTSVLSFDISKPEKFSEQDSKYLGNLKEPDIRSCVYHLISLDYTAKEIRTFIERNFNRRYSIEQIKQMRAS